MGFAPWSDELCALEQDNTRLGAMGFAPWSNELCALEQDNMRLEAMGFAPWSKIACALEQDNMRLGTAPRFPHKGDFCPLEQCNLSLGAINRASMNKRPKSISKNRFLTVMNKSHSTCVRVCTRVPYLYILSSHNKCILQAQQKSIGACNYSAIKL